MAAPKSTPRDAQVMTAILKDMGVTEYEPRVVNQMLEFTYRYVTDILDDSKVYSGHANKKNIDTDDVKLAVQYRLDHSFTSPPPRDLLMDIARHKNTNPLPLIKPYTGPKLPPDRYCLFQPNYQLRSIKKPQQSAMRLQSSGIMSALNPKVAISATPTVLTKPGGSLVSVGGTSLALVTRGVSQPTVTIRPASASLGSTPAPLPIIRLAPGNAPTAGSGLTTTTFSSLTTPAVSIESLKRKREDDDYDQG